MTNIDPTAVIERMARRLRASGAPHPVAGAVSLAARGRTRLGQADFAATVELLADTVDSAERGDVPFGSLPPEIGLIAAATGADLLTLADLETHWRTGPPADRSHDEHEGNPAMTEPDDDLTATRTTPPPAEIAEEYTEVAPGFWLATVMYSDLVAPDATVASLSWDGDSPAGADLAWLDRFGDHYAWTSTWTDGPTYLGHHDTTADAVAAWRSETVEPGSRPRLTTRTERWTGPVPN